VLPRRTLLAASLAVFASPSLAVATAPPDGTYLAVLDRFEAAADGRLAVLVLEEAGETRGRLVVPADDLPSGARHQDAVLEVVVRDGDLASAHYLQAETRRRAEAAQAQFDRLAHGHCGDD
jgi:hypothetical protein